MKTTMDWLRRGLMNAPDVAAITCADVELTYDDLMTRCGRLTAALRARFSGTDRIAVLAANSHRYLELYLAVTGAGLILVPLDPARSNADLRAVLRDAGAAAIFADRKVSGLGVGCAVAFGDEYEELIADGAGSTESSSDVCAETIAAVFYTGGTTGAPKGTMLTHGNLAANARNLVSGLDITRSTRWLVAAPMFHISGTVGTLATLGSGGQHFVIPTQNPDELLAFASRHEVTTTLVLPPMLAELAAAQQRRPRTLASLGMIAHGGGPITDAELVRAHEAFPRAELVHLYGATELSPIATILREEQQLLGHPRGRSCGRAIGDVAVEIRTPSGSVAPVGDFGEVFVRGETVMAGYWRRPELSAVKDGWYRTGDWGRLDECGYLYIVDRVANLIFSGSSTIFSTTVEQALCDVDGVEEAAVRPGAKGGLHAVVVSHGATGVSRACRRVLEEFGAAFQLTVRRRQLPRSGAGKILKRQLI